MITPTLGVSVRQIIIPVDEASVRLLMSSVLLFFEGKVKRGAFAAGRKITRIISFSKKKPPRPGDPRTSCSDPGQGQTSLYISHSIFLQMYRLVTPPPSRTPPHRLPVGAGESGVAGAVVLCEQRFPAFLPRQGRLPHLPALPPPPGL